MPFPPLSLTPLTVLCELLDAAGVPAQLDPADVSPPGAWVHLEGINTAANLEGVHELQVIVHLITGDTDTRRALEGLGVLYSQLLEVVTPDGLVTLEGVVLPGSTTPLPALRVPVNIH